MKMIRCEYSFRHLWVQVFLLGVVSMLSSSGIARDVSMPSGLMVTDQAIKNPEADYLMGKYNPAKHSLFVKIPRKYADRSGLYLRQEALAAYIKMQRAARGDGIHLLIRSATRSFRDQKRIWERKWQGKRRLSDGTNARHIANPARRALRILEYSAMPGTSRHHWGSDIDLNAFNNAWFESGEGLKLFQWLTKNAARYGFCRPYTANRKSGYKEEKWHWSYMPVARPLLQSVPQVLQDNQIKGFLGSATAVSIGVVDKYVLSVNPQCQ